MQTDEEANTSQEHHSLKATEEDQDTIPAVSFDLAARRVRSCGQCWRPGTEEMSSGM